MLKTTRHGPNRYIKILLVGGKSKSFSKFEYLLEFLNKENYDSNFTSWLCFDKGDATEGIATSSFPKPGAEQCLPTRLQISDPDFSTRQHNYK